MCNVIMPKCQCIVASGKRAGLQCANNAKSGKYCGVHKSCKKAVGSAAAPAPAPPKKQSKQAKQQAEKAGKEETVLVKPVADLVSWYLDGQLRTTRPNRHIFTGKAPIVINTGIPAWGKEEDPDGEILVHLDPKATGGLSVRQVFDAIKYALQQEREIPANDDYPYGDMGYYEGFKRTGPNRFDLLLD